MKVQFTVRLGDQKEAETNNGECNERAVSGSPRVVLSVSQITLLSEDAHGRVISPTRARAQVDSVTIDLTLKTVWP